MKIKDFISNNYDIFDNWFKQIKKNPENIIILRLKILMPISYQNFKYSIKFHDNENKEIFTLISKLSRKINFKKLMEYCFFSRRHRSLYKGVKFNSSNIF